MAISVDWGTGIITIPKIDSIQLQPSPEIRQIDANQIHKDLRALEAGEEGMPFTNTHVHNTEVLLSGVTYARTITILPPYTIEFEDGQYQINIINANHNFADVKVVNQVSLLIGNSAGLIVTGGGSTPVQIADAVWAYDISGVVAGAGLALNLLNKFIVNKMTIDNITRSPAVYLQIWNDIGDTVAYEQRLKTTLGIDPTVDSTSIASRDVKTDI